MLKKSIELNHYQRLMLQLSRSSAYNAVHVVCLKNEVNQLPCLQASLAATINQLAIGAPSFSSTLDHATYAPLAEPIQIECSTLSLDEHVEKEINYFFSLNEFPLRFFIITHSSNVYFSITYNHWICDAYAISQLMAAIFNRIQHPKEPLPLTLNAPPIKECFKHIYKYKTFYYRYLGVIQTALRFSRAFRTDVSNVESTESGCFSHLFDKETLEQLLGVCKTQRITLNDLFVTSLAQLFGRITQKKRAALKSKPLKPKRSRIVIGVMSNIRAQSQTPLTHAFGLFLGFFYLSFNAPEQRSFETLSNHINAQTMRLKEKNAAIKQYLLFKIQNTMWSKAKTKHSKYRLFSKNTPITVGISNMVLRDENEALKNSVHQYTRYSPTAMVCPIVFNLTTINDCLSVSVTYRKACYTSEEAKFIKDEFIRMMHVLTSRPN